jgi:hypothetical protein
LIGEGLADIAVGTCVDSFFREHRLCLLLCMGYLYWFMSIFILDVMSCGSAHYSYILLQGFSALISLLPYIVGSNLYLYLQDIWVSIKYTLG